MSKFIRNSRPALSEPQNQEIGKFYVLQERRVTDFKARKLWKGRSGWNKPTENRNSPAKHCTTFGTTRKLSRCTSHMLTQILVTSRILKCFVGKEKCPDVFETGGAIKENVKKGRSGKVVVLAFHKKKPPGKASLPNTRKSGECVPYPCIFLVPAPLFRNKIVVHILRA